MMIPQIATIAFAAAATMALGTEPANGTLHGTVRDPNGAAVAGARVEVTCDRDRKQGISGPTGDFSINGLPMATCIVTARSAMYEAATAEVNLSQGDARATLVMSIPAFETSVTVTASRGLDEQT